MVVLPFLTSTVLPLCTFLGKNFSFLVFNKGLPVIFYLRIFIRLLEDARVAIEQEKKAAMADIRQQVATLSVEIAEKVLRANLKNDASQMELINRMLDDNVSAN